MALTLEELKERMAARLDETTILEVLEIDAEMLVERFSDEIETRFDKLCQDLSVDEEE